MFFTYKTECQLNIKLSATLLLWKSVPFVHEIESQPLVKLSDYNVASSDFRKLELRLKSLNIATHFEYICHSIYWGVSIQSKCFYFCCLIPWQLVKFFVLFPCVRNEFSTTLNCRLIIVATAEQGWSLSSYSGNDIFFLLLISTKIMSKKRFILFNWSFLPQMWNKRFDIVIYCLSSLYVVTKAICPLWKGGVHVPRKCATWVVCLLKAGMLALEGGTHCQGR